MVNRAERVFDLEQPRTEGMPIHPAHRSRYSYSCPPPQDEYRPDGPANAAAPQAS